MKLTPGLHPDEFLNLIQEVEEQGGTHLSERCIARPYKLKLPAPGSKYKRIKEVFRTGCGNESRFLVPYEPDAQVRIYRFDPKAKNGIGESKLAPPDKGSGLATVCAVDDGMRLWPRFQDAFKED